MPHAWRWILAGCAILILLPSLSTACLEFLTGLSRALPRGLKRAGRYYSYALFSLIAGVIFWLFRVKTYLLGDSFLRARDIEAGVNNANAKKFGEFTSAQFALEMIEGVQKVRFIKRSKK